jgi:hypothetical protein
MARRQRLHHREVMSMSSLSLIHGVVMARDEWPLLELAITHALLQHVDRVWVLDHASTDGTAAGLRRLCDLWGNRITVVRLETTPYLQEAATSLLLEVVNPGPDDWVYVFDADEFAITPAATSLRDILNRATPEHGVVRYQVDNWVASQGFDDTDFEQYPGLIYRAVPNLFLELGPEVTSDEIQHGTISFFDVPFASKVIVRGGSSGWLAAGSHALKPCSMVREMALSPDQFRVAHFPLLSRKRLALKVRQGRDLIAQGFHRLHGWQSQMLARFDTSGLLDDFWSRHSVGHADDLDHGGSPLVVRDDTFSQAIGPTLALLRRNQRPAEWVFPRADADTTLLLSAALRAMQKLQALAETLAGQQRFATGACAAARAERDAIAAERDALMTSCTVPSGTSAPALRVATESFEQSRTSRIGCSRKVFGIGWAKTGTKTLGACFEILGLSHQGPDLSIVKDLPAGDLSRIMSLASEKQAFEDWPWLLLYRELDEAFPGSLFVLTNRSPERWLRSYRTMLASQGVPSSEMNELRSILYGFAFPDVSDSQLLERFNRHNHEVRSYFRGRADDLLVVDWEAGCGWRELCAFLGMAIPERPFPWVNRGHQEVTVGVHA